MKKSLLIFLFLVLFPPSLALAATQFSLGGYIKLESFWDSTQESKDMSTAIQRNNNALFQHGRFQTTAHYSRLNLEVKGPNLWGAKSLAFIEMDFNSAQDPLLNATHGFVPRLRHAMFKLTWPETELLVGQYYALLDEYRPESVQDTVLQFKGATSYRVPQIRLTQKFLGAWSVAASINKPTDPTIGQAPFPGGGDANFEPGAPALGVAGQNSETPNFQAMIRYEKDLWGKAPFEGSPRGFTAQVTGGWQRTRYQSGSGAANAFATFSQNAFGTFAAAGTVTQRNQQFLQPWMVMADLFIPLLPAHSYNLAGSASLSAQWFIGQGLAPFGYGRDQDQSFLRFVGISPTGQFLYDRQLTKQFGGYVQGQYWFTNEWYVNLLWGMTRNFGIDRSISGALAGSQPNNPVGYVYASNNDQLKLWQELDLTLWYNPIKALKFGLQYSYGRTDWLQRLTTPAVPQNNAAGGQASQNTNFNAGAKDFADSQRVMGAAWFFF